MNVCSWAKELINFKDQNHSWASHSLENHWFGFCDHLDFYIIALCKDGIQKYIVAMDLRKYLTSIKKFTVFDNNLVAE